MIESLHVVKNEDAAVTWRKACNGAIDGQAVNGSSLSQITSTKFASRPFFRDVGHQMIQRNYCQNSLTQVHQDNVYGEPMQPCCKDRVAPEGIEFSMNLKKGLLRQVFCKRRISHDPHADGEDAPFVLGVEL